MFNFIRTVYTKRLESKIAKGKMPRHIMVVADEIDEEKLASFARWCEQFGISEITVCVHEYTPEFKKIAERLGCRVIHRDGVVERQRRGVMLNIIAGIGGRYEIVEAVKKLARLVEERKLSPEEVDEELFEAHLRVKSPPDLIIRAGTQIPDFLIWQSIYSELQFLDTDWKSFRYIDFLRCLRDYQRRERRYGK